jgi:predicted GNAT family acetyltransferase
MSETAANDHEIRVVDNPDENQFEAHIDGHVALVSYLRRGDTIFLTHTEVPKELEGRGVGSILARAALERAKSEHWQVVPRCPFIAKYIERHAEFQPLVRREL